MTGTTIHRDGTFEFNGRTYRCTRQGPYGSADDAYEVWDMETGRSVGTFFRLDEVRAHVDQSRENGWPL